MTTQQVKLTTHKLYCVLVLQTKRVCIYHLQVQLLSLHIFLRRGLRAGNSKIIFLQESEYEGIS